MIRALTYQVMDVVYWTVIVERTDPLSGAARVDVTTYKGHYAAEGESNEDAFYLFARALLAAAEDPQRAL